MLPLVILLGIGLFLIFLALTMYLTAGVSHESALLETVTKGTRRPVRDTEDEEEEESRVGLLLDRLTKPLRALRGLISAKPDSALSRRLSRAGYRRPAHVDLFLAARLAVPAIAGLTVVYTISEGVFLFLIIAVVIGFFAPDFWLTEAVNRRRRRIDRSLPDGLDLLAICLEAGLGLDQAIVRVGNELKNTHPDFSTELLTINFEQRAGVPRIESWKAFSDRLDSESVRSFVAMLIQTERFGTPIALALSAFSDSLRIQRRQKAEELANKAAIKLLFPLVFFIFPLVFLVTVGPAIISLLHSLEELAK
jgi:tight adherence protein C